MNAHSGFLYAEPSFLEGIGRIFDFGGTLVEFNRSLTAAQADRLALRGDWRAIGLDLSRVIAEQLALPLGEPACWQGATP